jgi:hypothetical protein
MTAMGVCIEPPDYVAGLKRFETNVFRTKPDGVRLSVCLVRQRA